MARGSSVFPESPLQLFLFGRRTCRCCWRPAALPSFLWSPRPLPLCPAEVPCPRRKPGGGGQAPAGLLRPLQAAFRAFWAHRPGPCVSSVWIQTPRYVFRFPPRGHSHRAGLMGSSSPPWGHGCLVRQALCSSLSILLPCGLPAAGTD